MTVVHAVVLQDMPGIPRGTVNSSYKQTPRQDSTCSIVWEIFIFRKIRTLTCDIIFRKLTLPWGT